MARAPRIDVGGYVYHVINRANAKARIFHSDADYIDFEYLLAEIVETLDMRILAYCIMPNHWHLLLYPREDGDLGTTMHWLTTSHVRRHHARHKTIGHGHLYQGTYKSFLVENDAHLLTVLKYIERNAVRANLSATAAGWRWGSAHRRATNKAHPLLAESPIPLPHNYSTWINEPEQSEELVDIRRSVEKSVPYGNIIVSKNTES